MPRTRVASVPLAPVEREALAGELIGAAVELRAPGVSGPVAGTVVDESLGTISVRLPGRSRPRRIPKVGLLGTILLEGREIPLSGEVLRVRPEDRTKRLLAGGPRRFR